jgi:hypothetical protein
VKWTLKNWNQRGDGNFDDDFGIISLILVCGPLTFSVAALMQQKGCYSWNYYLWISVYIFKNVVWWAACCNATLVEELLVDGRLPAAHTGMQCLAMQWQRRWPLPLARTVNKLQSQNCVGLSLAIHFLWKEQSHRRSSPGSHPTTRAWNFWNQPMEYVWMAHPAH